MPIWTATCAHCFVNWKAEFYPAFPRPAHSLRTDLSTGRARTGWPPSRSFCCLRAFRAHPGAGQALQIFNFPPGRSGSTTWQADTIHAASGIFSGRSGDFWNNAPSETLPLECQDCHKSYIECPEFFRINPHLICKNLRLAKSACLGFSIERISLRQL